MTSSGTSPCPTGISDPVSPDWSRKRPPPVVRGPPGLRRAGLRPRSRFSELPSELPAFAKRFCETCRVDLTPEHAAAAVERHPCPKCAASAGSPCRTGGGKTAARYHTARFILVPALREELNVAVPPDRSPGRPWSPRPSAGAGMAEVPAGQPIRIGYARCSTARQELASQLAALEVAGCTRVFSEKISTRVRVRPELEQALRLCRDIKDAAPDQAVILTVHEMKRLARNAAELMTLAGALQAAGIQLELLSGPLTGIYDPN